MADSASDVVSYKRGRYVHSAYDKEKGTWLYQNLINRALIEADDAENDVIYSFLNEPSRHPKDAYEAELRSALIAGRFLIEADIDELSILERRYWQQKRSQQQASLAVVTTLQCNLRCEYCYQEHVDESLSREDEYRIIRFIDGLTSAQNISADPDSVHLFGLSWWGGEPLLRIDAIQRMSTQFIPILDERGVKYNCHMSTNAVLLTKSNCRILRDARLSRVQITIDGPEEFHDAQRFNVAGSGTYRAVLRGLNNIAEELSALGRFITLRVNVTPRMVSDLSSWNRFVSDLRSVSNHIALNIHQAVPNDFFRKEKSLVNDHYIQLYYKLKDIVRSTGFTCLEDSEAIRPSALYCGAIPNNNWILLPGGRVTKCTDKFHDRASDCGTLNDDGSLDLFDKAQEWLEYSPFSSDMCRSCDVLPICMGGCRVVPFVSKNGDRCIRKTIVEHSILSNPSRVKMKP